ncbi:protein yellow-like [Cloeon dipterum]|uniref:protein yellow-like n=1 Tax=Cloeon dipterum TaxID=197152 RepID=UPI00321FDA01
MAPFLCTIFLLDLSSLATTANFNQVFKWDELDYEWPSDANRTKALEDGNFKPKNIEPRFMAVHGTRIVLSLYKHHISIPASLVSLPMSSSASSAPPKLTPFPSWDMHEKGGCNKIEEVTGLQVDSVGRLWVLDNGSENCNAKLWKIDLANNNHIKLIHRFPFQKWMHDLVLDETPNETLAYITRGVEQNIVVFSLERNKSWFVDTPGIKAYSIALSPNNKDEEARQLYLGEWNFNELNSISVAALRNGTRIANSKLIGKWTAISSYRMLIDNQGTMYAAFQGNNFIYSWKTSQPFEEQRFHEVAGLDTGLPFTLALDQNGTLWMTVFDDKRKPRYMLLKAASVFLSDHPTFKVSGFNSTSFAINGGEPQRRILINSSVFFVLLFAMAISYCYSFTSAGLGIFFAVK